MPGALKRARILAKSFDFFGSISRYFCIFWSIFFASPALGQTAETILGDTGIGNNLSFTRSGNRLTGLSDTGSPGGTFTFAYDALGNLASDGRKGLVFSYNVCTLPREVTSGASGSEENAGSILICVMYMISSEDQIDDKLSIAARKIATKVVDHPMLIEISARQRAAERKEGRREWKPCTFRLLSNDRKGFVGRSCRTLR